jgi:tRNA (guanine37-N1)-methyltransferase
VPEVLVSGDHGAVARWRLREALRRTLRRRPDLLDVAELGPREREMLAELRAEEETAAAAAAEAPATDAAKPADRRRRVRAAD